MKIILDIRPQPKQSVRGGRHFYTDPKKKKYVNDLKMLIKSQHKGCVSNRPINLIIEFVFKPPKSWSKKKKSRALLNDIRHTSRPDGDNLAKPVKDACSGILWVDDSQVCVEQYRKEYGHEDLIRIYWDEMSGECSNKEEVK